MEERNESPLSFPPTAPHIRIMGGCARFYTILSEFKAFSVHIVTSRYTHVMYNHEPPGYECPLCLIAAGKPTDRGDQEPDVFYRDEICTAYVAGKWWRSNPGHVIIMPNNHYENLYDLPSEVGHRIFDVSQQVALALKKTYPCEGVSTRQHNEPAGNQDVWHYHLHVFPRNGGDELYLNHKDTYWPTAEEKRPYAEKLKAYFALR
jgi:histidine triad (HIT) family protein